MVSGQVEAGTPSDTLRGAPPRAGPGPGPAGGSCEALVETTAGWALSSLALPVLKRGLGGTGSPPGALPTGRQRTVLAAGSRLGLWWLTGSEAVPAAVALDAWSLGQHPPTPCSATQDPEGKPKKTHIQDNHDGTYTVAYVPDVTGRYTILIKYGGDEIPFSPYRVRAVPTGDASKCTVTGEPARRRPRRSARGLGVPVCKGPLLGAACGSGGRPPE